MTAPNRQEPQHISLTPAFGASLRLALTGGGDHKSFGVPSSDTRRAGVDLALLDEYGRSQWENILQYVVNNGAESMHQTGTRISESVKELLAKGGLVARGRGANLITKDGFSFLLQEVNAQVWTILLLWLNHAKDVCLPRLCVVKC